MTETGAHRQVTMMTRVKQLGRGVLVGATMLLAACQTMIPRTSGPETTGPAQPTEQPGQGLPTDTQRHRIALLVPMAGPNAGLGQSIANATTMALLDTNAENLRITTYDTSQGAGIAANRAVADGNKLILGPLTGEEVKVAAPIARAASVPVISYSNDASVAGNGVFLMGYTPNQSISRIVTYARGKGVNRFAALVPKGVYGERAGTALLRAVEAAGGTVVAMQSFDRTPAGMTAAAKKLAENSAYDAVLIADGGRVAMQYAPIIRKTGGVSARLLGTELWNTENAIAASPALRGAWFASVSDAYYRQLATKYRARFGTAPYRLSALGYDSVLLTVKIAQTWRPGTMFPTAALFDEGGFVGIDGAFRFRRDGTADRALEVQQVDAGKFTVIDAAPRGFGK